MWHKWLAVHQKLGNTDVRTVHMSLNHLNTWQEWGCRAPGPGGSAAGVGGRRDSVDGVEENSWSTMEFNCLLSCAMLVLSC